MKPTIFALGLANASFGDTARTGLSPEQTRVLATARREYGQDWRIHVKRVDGETKTVLLFGQHGRSHPTEDVFTKDLLDEFHHFGVFTPSIGYYASDGFERKRPHSEMAVRARNAKSLHDLARFHQSTVGERFEKSLTFTLDVILGTTYEGFTDAWEQGRANEIVIGLALLGFATRASLYLARDHLPHRKNEIHAVAPFLDHWALTKPAHKILVALMPERYVERIEGVMKTRYAFERLEP